MVRKVILIFFIGINILHLDALKGQGYASLADINHAEYLYQHSNYDAALREFMRCNYFRIKSDTIDISKRISDLYLQKGEFKKALNYLDRWYFENINNEEKKFEAIIAKTRIHTMSNDYNTAIIELLQLPETDNTTVNDRVKYYLFINYLLANNIQDATKYGFDLSYLSDIEKNELSILFKKYQKIIKKNPNHAALLSSIIPGLGQMVNGDVKDGLISLAVVGGLAILFIDVTRSLSFQDAAFSITPWLVRYHIGGLNNAKNQAKRNIEKKKLEIINQINQSLMKAAAN